MHDVSLGAGETAGLEILLLAVEQRAPAVLDDRCTGVRQRDERAVEGASPPRHRARSITLASGTSSRRPFAASAAQGRRRNACEDRIEGRAASTELASGPIESSVHDSGKAPRVGTRRAVGLKPTTPHNAAGIRTEPRVSVPSDITHMPSACATPAPDDEPPGTRPVADPTGFSACRNAVQADAAERELDHVRAPDDHGAGSAQARDDGRVALRRRRVGEQLRSGARDVAGDVEQVLHRNRQAVDRRAHDADASQLVRQVGLGARGVGVKLDERALPFARRIADARERRFDEITRRHFARRKLARQLPHLHRRRPGFIGRPV